jgi:hypothetical protein
MSFDLDDEERRRHFLRRFPSSGRRSLQEILKDINHKGHSSGLECRDRLDSYLRLAELGYAKFDGRRQYEWKITLSYWIILIMALAYMKRDVVAILAIHLISILYVFIWIRGNWLANANDKAISDHFMKAADSVLRDATFIADALPPRVRGGRRFVGFLSDWSALGQIATTIALNVMLYVVPQMGNLSKT